MEYDSVVAADGPFIERSRTLKTCGHGRRIFIPLLSSYVNDNTNR
jgi:hypothetical protein